MHLLLSEMNEILAKHAGTTHSEMNDKLSVGARAVFDLLPSDIRQQMMADRDPHGNVQVSKIETEKLLISVVTEELRKRAADGKYSGTSLFPHSRNFLTFF
jgi:pyrophosphate--fructose-6-phosphate 1-phosphotransferase